MNNDAIHLIWDFMCSLVKDSISITTRQDYRMSLVPVQEVKDIIWGAVKSTQEKSGTWGDKFVGMK